MNGYIVGANHPLLAEKNLTLRQLFASHTPFILRERGSGTRAVLEEALELHGLEPLKPILELGSTEAIKQAVAAGLGVSFVSEHTVKLEVAVGLVKILSLTDFELKRPLYLVYVQSKKLSRASKTFLELLT